MVSMGVIPERFNWERKSYMSVRGPMPHDLCPPIE